MTVVVVAVTVNVRVGIVLVEHAAHLQLIAEMALAAVEKIAQTVQLTVCQAVKYAVVELSLLASVAAIVIA